MTKQNFENHVRYYFPHHFIFYPVVISTLSIAIYYSIKLASLEWGIISLLVILIGSLSFMMRQHYALMNQNRIVRLEMRVRYFILTGQSLESLENKLNFSQIAALRFASDAELVKLIDLTVQHDYSSKKIKQSIVEWKADDMRV